MLPAGVCTGLTTSKPASTMSSSNRQIEPHECMNACHGVPKLLRQTQLV